MQKSVIIVDLVKSFHTSIYLQTSASILPRTDLSKFANNVPTVRRKMKKVRKNVGPRGRRRCADRCRLAGLANRGRIIDPSHILAEIGRMNALKKVRIHTIGIGNNHDRRLMKGLADLSGGTYVAK